MSRRQYVVSAGDRAAFERDGAVCIRGLFTPEELFLAARGIEQNLQSPSEHAKVASTPDDPGFFFQDFCNWERISEYRDLIFGSAAASSVDLVASWCSLAAPMKCKPTGFGSASMCG